MALLCPDRRELGAYLQGNLSEEQSELIERHLAECSACEAAAGELERQPDSIVVALREKRDPFARYADEPEYWRAVDAARQLAPHSDAPTDREEPPSVPAQLDVYQVLGRLGKGGMGEVYKALQTRLGKVVAIKFPPKDRIGDAAAVARFLREAKALGQMDHPNLVRALDAREIDGLPLLVMEFVEGANLAVVADRAEPLSVADACELARQTALGLAYAHRNGLVHRDLKPSNIMLNPAGVVKILDLGLALLVSDQGGIETSFGAAMGTAEYMAPEQVEDAHGVDLRADIYSLGCTLYRLLAGEPPFPQSQYANRFGVMNAQIREEPPSIAERRPDLPGELVDLVHRMLAKSSDDRPPTADEVAQALAPLAAGQDLVALAGRAGGLAGAEPATMPTDPAAKSAFEPTEPRARPRPKPAAKRRPPRRRLLILVAGILPVVLLGITIIIKIKIDSDKKAAIATNVEVPSAVDTGTLERPQTPVPLPNVPLRMLWSRHIKSEGTIHFTAVKLAPDGRAVFLFHNTLSPIAVVDKLDAASGDTLWERTYKLDGGSSAGGCVDRQGNLFLSSTAYPVGVTRGRQSWLPGTRTVWKFDPEFRKMLWSYTYDKGPGFEAPEAMRADAQGNLYVSAYTPSKVGEGSACVILDPQGKPRWPPRVMDEGAAGNYCVVAIDPQGNLFRAGNDNPGDNASSRGRVLGHRAADGAEFFDYQVPEASSRVGGLAFDASDNVFIAYTHSRLRDKTTESGKEQMALARLDRHGKVLWTRQFPVGTHDTDGGLLPAGKASFYVAFRRREGPMSSPVLAEFDTEGNVLWTHDLSMPGWELGPHCLDAADGKIFVGLNPIGSPLEAKVFAFQAPKAADSTKPK